MNDSKKTREVRILAIESSCDETAAAVVVNGRDMRSNVISSQIALHTLYGGVVPEIASRKHIGHTLKHNIMHITIKCTYYQYIFCTQNVTKIHCLNDF